MFRFFFVVFLLSAVQAGASCREDQLHLRGTWGQAAFSVEVADDAPERELGLMNRAEMARGAGMLFVYEHPQRVAFWMRNTLIPLDMIFADETGVVRRVHANAVPLDETAIPGGDGIMYVLEINGGLAAQFGIAEGTELRHPAIAADLAAWPCD